MSQNELFEEGLSRLPDVLKHLGFVTLRKGQDAAVMNLLRVKDTICLLPTGRGKSAVFVVPTLAHKWRTLIFSPLIALMQDQVHGLLARDLKAGMIASSQSESENRYVIQQWMAGQLQFLFVAPERLSNEQFQKCMTDQPPNLVTVDEAHMVSEWADSFRTDYKKIGTFIDQSRPDVTLALTATATASVEEDIRNVFRMEHSDKVAYLPRRDNLHMASRDFTSDERLLDHINEVTPKGSVIVYCATRKQVESFHEAVRLTTHRSTAFYHGGLGKNERSASMAAFMEDRADILVATNAFGMGVNKANVRGVFHRDCPSSIEAIAQESGRAGRDDLDSYCCVFHDNRIWHTHRFLLDLSYPKVETVKRVWDELTDLRQGERVLTMTVDAIATKIGMRSDAVSGSLAILKANGVVSRDNLPGDVARFQILAESPGHPNHVEFIKQLVQNGRDAGGWWYEVSLNHMSGIIGNVVTTIRRTCRDLHDGGFVNYQAPFRGKVTEFIGDISEVNFERLQQKRDEGFRRMQEVKEYLTLPDGDKSRYITNYFSNEHDV